MISKTLITACHNENHQSSLEITFNKNENKKARTNWHNRLRSLASHSSANSKNEHKVISLKNSPVNQLTTDIVPTNGHLIQITIQTIQIVMNVAVEVMA